MQGTSFLSNTIFEIKNHYFKPVDVVGDGDCFFRSLCVNPFFSNKGYNHNSLRKYLSTQTREAIKNGTDEFKLVIKRHIQYNNSNKNKIDDESVALNYVNRTMSRSGCWAGFFEAMMITFFFNIDIITVDTSPSGVSFESSLFKIKQYYKNYNNPEVNMSKKIYIYLHQYNFPFKNSRGPFHSPNHYLHLELLSQPQSPQEYNIVHLPNEEQSTINSSSSLSPPLLPSSLLPPPPSSSSSSTTTTSSSAAAAAVAAKPSQQQNNITTKKQQLSLSYHKKTSPVKKEQNVKHSSQKSTKKLTSFTVGFWNNKCEVYARGNYKSLRSFLNHPDSAPLTPSNFSAFQRYHKKYKDGKLNSLSSSNGNNYRQRKGNFHDIEEKIVDYIILRQKLFLTTKVGLSCKFLQQKSQQFFDNLSEEEKDGRQFKASNGWISKVMSRNGFSSHVIHGEAGEMNDEEKKKATIKVQSEIDVIVKKYNINASKIYNADQTGLFYNKLPNRMYLRKEQVKNTRGVKLMKSKDRLTLMVATAADGTKCPLYSVGKSAVPESVRRLNGGKFPIAYTHQKNAWFDKYVMV